MAKSRWERISGVFTYLILSDHTKLCRYRREGNNGMVSKINENEGKLDPVDAEDLRA